MRLNRNNDYSSNLATDMENDYIRFEVNVPSFESSWSWESLNDMETHFSTFSLNIP